ncbi:Fur family transcriptional regulator [Clostridium sp. JN-1]|jgi:Fe2+ or Zn2+ uptake regulation protein|uniref:Fur family transcriptional regulator n=1 Tax=Clostridium sp. JN-1 TaxID=2483110 RepID=UPI001FA9DF2B|nr:Fur family transcriptional regulator [Clostridium sp. JN-1]
METWGEIVLETSKYLKKKGLKVTKARVNILNILLESEKAISAEYIFEECKSKNENIDLSTVYRTLELFENKNIIIRFNLDKQRYVYAIKKEHHKHILKCIMCHKRVEIDCPMQQVKQIIKNNTGFDLFDEGLKTNIEGICEECQKKVKSKNR